MRKSQISIIVPVYNAEAHLSKCLDSILAQSYQSWECILVDDGSKDRSGEICEEYALRDNRFTVIHKENGGVSAARNNGIEKASGEWFLFCDSDDLLSDDALKVYVDRIKDGIDSVCGGYVEIDDKEGSIIKLSTSRDYEIEIGRIEALTDFYEIQYGDLYNYYLWNRLLKADIIRQNNLRFREDIYITEDGLFLVQFLCKSTGLHAYTSKLVYKYRRNQAGVMSNCSESFNNKSCSNLVAKCACYETIKSVTDDAKLIDYSKRSVTGQYLRLILYFIKGRNTDISKLVEISRITFKHVSQFTVIYNIIRYIWVRKVRR